MFWNRLVVRLLPLLPRFLVWRVARRYVAGRDQASALQTLDDLSAEGVRGTLSLLGEHVTQAEQALAAREELLALIAALPPDTSISVDERPYLSIKPSQLGAGLDTALAHEHFRAVLAAARERELFVRLDMEDHRTVDDTLSLHQALRTHFGAGSVGLVLQAYLRRTPADVAALPPGSDVRLCKGIYLEPREVAWQDFDTVRSNFSGLLDKLWTAGHRVAVATHDEHLVSEAEGLIDRLGLGPDRYEFQMLHGVDPSLRRIILDQGHPLRVYLPFGKDWYTYSIRRLRENPKVAGHVIRAMFRRRRG